MLKRQTMRKKNKVKVTFVLPGNLPEIAVAGDFNEWDTTSHPLRRRSNGTRSAAVELEPGQQYHFRYYNPDNDRWFNDEEADGYAPSVFGSQNCVIET